MFDTATRCEQPRSLDDIRATRNVEILTLVLQSHGFSYQPPSPKTPGHVGCQGCSDNAAGVNGAPGDAPCITGRQQLDNNSASPGSQT